MMIKFFPRGRGGGRGPTEYLTKETVTVDGKTTTRNPAPEVLRGNTANTRALIDTCQHKYKYTSGVIAFAGDDAPTEAQQQQVMDDFERLAFAGLEPDQYDILWVRHRHEGNTELHMVVPRQELTTGKALNIAPPGHAKYYDHLRDAWNYEQGWARPDDPARALAQSKDITYGKPHLVERADAKTEITELLLQRIQAGEITDRVGVIDALSELGEVTRQGKDYISVKPEGFNKALRLRGGIYGQDFDVRAIATSREQATAGPGENREAHAERATKARAKLAGWIERRAGYNESRYKRPAERDHGLDRELENQHDQRQPIDTEATKNRSGRDQNSIESKPESRSEQPEMGLAEIQPASAVGLADHLRRELGANALAIEPANTDAGTDKPEQTDTKKSAWWREIRESAGRKLSDFSERARALPDAIRRVGDEVKKIVESGYDRARDEINKLVEVVRGRVERAGESFTGADRGLAAAGAGLNESGQHLDSAYRSIGRSVQQSSRTVERGIAVVRANRQDELADFKQQISLPEYAASLGYQVIRNESSRNSVVMQRESDNDKVIIATASDGHGIYFSVRDDQDNGSIIDFAQKRQGLNLGEVRKELRPWQGAEPLPVPERIKKPLPSTADRQKVLQSFAQAKPAGAHEYLMSRGISPEVLADSRFVGAIRTDNRGNAIFPHYDREGLSGFELKNEGFTGFASGGSKALWYSSNISRAEKVVVTETAIDALSHYQAFGGDHAYASIGGSMSPEQQELIRGWLVKAHESGQTLVIATDNDQAGAQFAEQISELAPAGLVIERDAPGHGKDWNDTLNYYKEHSFAWEHEQQQRDAEDDYEGPSMG